MTIRQRAWVFGAPWSLTIEYSTPAVSTGRTTRQKNCFLPFEPKESPPIRRKELVRPEGLEPPACWFEARRSIQLSYGRTSRDQPAQSLPLRSLGARRGLFAILNA